MITEREIRDRIKVYEHKLKQLRKLANEELKTEFELTVSNDSHIKFEDLEFSTENGDGVEFSEFMKFLCEGDVILIKLIKRNDVEEED